MVLLERVRLVPYDALRGCLRGNAVKLPAGAAELQPTRRVVLRHVRVTQAQAREWLQRPLLRQRSDVAGPRQNPDLRWIPRRKPRADLRNEVTGRGVLDFDARLGREGSRHFQELRFVGFALIAVAVSPAATTESATANVTNRLRRFNSILLPRGGREAPPFQDPSFDLLNPRVIRCYLAYEGQLNAVRSDSARFRGRIHGVSRPEWRRRPLPRPAPSSLKGRARRSHGPRPGRE